MADTDKMAAERLDRFERAAMAYERLGKLTKDDEKTREIRKAAIAELADARRALLEERSAREAALAAANDIDVKTVVQELNVEDHRQYNRIITALEAENKRLREERERFLDSPEYINGWNDGFEHVTSEDLRFPTMIRKMWSGGEVQDWLDKEFALRRARDLSRNRRETTPEKEKDDEARSR